MGAILSYSIVSSILLACLYLVFKATLAGANQHGYNRAVVLCIYAVAFLFVPVSRLFTGAAAAQEPMTDNLQIDLAALIGPEQTVAPLWSTALVWGYLGGMALVSLLTACTWLRIFRIIRRGERQRQKGYTLVFIDNEHVSPFSWMRFVVMSRRDFADCGEAILAHERCHIALWHWLDLLVAQAAIIVGWFNPAAWLLRGELMLIHEYQADKAVVRSGCDAQQYQMLLLKKAAGGRFPSLTNSFNQSKIKMRVAMMYAEASSPMRRLCALALVPAAATAILIAAIPQVKAAIAAISSSELFASRTILSHTVTVKQYIVDPETNEVRETADLPEESHVHEVKRTIDMAARLKIEGSTLSITTLKDGVEESVQIALDKSKYDDGKAYIHNGRQISKAELDAIPPSSITSVQTARGEGVTVFLVIDTYYNYNK